MKAPWNCELALIKTGLRRFFALNIKDNHMNNLKTTLFLGLLTGLVILVGFWLGGQSGMMFALVASAVMNFSAYWWSDKLVLSTYGAKPASQTEYPELYVMIRELTSKAGLPMPRLFVMETEMPNAFATGRNADHAVVAVTTGLMRLLNQDEIKGVLAHELGHIKNNDMLIGSIAATIAGAISYLAQMAYFANIFGGSSDDEDDGGIFGALAVMILAPLVATLLHMAVSRSREYIADEAGALLCGNPQGLASALAKLGGFSKSHLLHGTPRQETASHLFIVNPFKPSALMALFSTHPPMEERIARLEKMVKR
jgi:heat shock protein HtpX